MLKKAKEVEEPASGTFLSTLPDFVFVMSFLFSRSQKGSFTMIGTTLIKPLLRLKTNVFSIT